jgi:hypothetical protein
MGNDYENRASSLRDVQRALWEHWDPIGLNTPDDPGPPDEYDAYAPLILGLIYRGADDLAIAHALLTIEVDRMESKPRPVETLLDVARKIREAYNAGLLRSAT